MESTRTEFDQLAEVYLPIAIAVFVLVAGAFGFFVLRGRRRSRPTGAATDAPRVEAAYVVVLVAVAATLTTLSLRSLNDVDAAASDPALTVKVTAFQWGWQFDYGKTGVSEIGDQSRPPTLRVPVGEPIRFELATRDVIHSFWVPSQRFKRDAIPGRTNSFDLIFDQLGMNGGKCAEYCGLNHFGMDFNVLALEPDAFERWLEERVGTAGEGVEEREEVVGDGDA